MTNKKGASEGAFFISQCTPPTGLAPKRYAVHTAEGAGTLRSYFVERFA